MPCSLSVRVYSYFRIDLPRYYCITRRYFTVPVCGVSCCLKKYGSSRTISRNRKSDFQHQSSVSTLGRVWVPSPNKRSSCALIPDELSSCFRASTGLFRRPIKRFPTDYVRMFFMLGNLSSKSTKIVPAGMELWSLFPLNVTLFREKKVTSRLKFFF